MGYIDEEKRVIYYTPRKVGSTLFDMIIDEYLPKNFSNTYLYRHFNPDYFRNRDTLKDFETVIIVREPKDMIISWFFWINRDTVKLMNKQQLINTFQRNYRQYIHVNIDMYNNKFKYKHIVRYESLKDDMYQLLSSYGYNIDSDRIDEIAKKDNRTKNIRDKGISINEFYNKNMVRQVDAIFSKLYMFKSYYNKL